MIGLDLLHSKLVLSHNRAFFGEYKKFAVTPDFSQGLEWGGWGYNNLIKNKIKYMYSTKEAIFYVKNNSFL